MCQELEVSIEQGKGGRIEHIVGRCDAESPTIISLDGLWGSGKGDDGKVVSEKPDGLFRPLVGIGRSSAAGSVVPDSIVPDNNDLAIMLVQSHAADTAAGILQNFRRLPLTLTADCQGQDPTGGRNEKSRLGPFTKLDSGYWLLRLEHCPLFGATIIDKVTTDGGNGSISKAYR